MITVSIDNMTRVHNYKSMPHAVHESLREMYEFRNPAYDEALKHKRYTGSIDERLVFWKAENDALVFPRGAARNIIKYLKNGHIDFEVKDGRRSFEPIELKFLSDLRSYQQAAVDDILKRDSGCLSAATGSGKTVMSLSVIAERKQPTLIICHNKTLADQWAERVQQYLGIDKAEIGMIGGGKFKIGEKITIALVQSLCKRSEDVVPFIGHVVVDEAHHTPSRTFTEALSSFDAKYILGLSATPFRKDGLGRLMWWYLGEMIHQVDASSLKAEGYVLTPDIFTRETGINNSEYDPVTEFSSFITSLLKNQARNELICEDVVSAVKGGRCCIVLSDRVFHCETLSTMLEERGIKAGMLNGTMKKQEREMVMNAIRSGDIRVVLATSSLAGEGLDIPALDTLFLVSPVKFKGRLIQYAGRILRPSKDKMKPAIYDYLDDFGVLKAQAASRQLAYETIAA